MGCKTIVLHDDVVSVEQNTTDGMIVVAFFMIESQKSIISIATRKQKKYLTKMTLTAINSKLDN
ncbi:MAG: hypothetical protein EAZ78_10685 [Oscillatoriales cyanobacterium]|nr:MAG: hypothetical protein EAZ78_10685 [Oscillatoriales cyanobacterium]